MAELLHQLQKALDGHYAVEHEIGRGGMAVVFLAGDLKHHRRVAIKVLKPELSQALGPDRFLREIEVAAQLTHPHILPVFDSGRADGLLYYVMPHVEGESLRALLEREGQLPLELALRLTCQIAAALEYAHRRGIVHRDLKPENILLESGEAVVADYGLALAISAAGTERLTESGLALGTPAYMSPEQAAGQPHLDGRSDLYSLGCILYEMLAGEPPFTGPTAQAIVAKRFGTVAPSIRLVREGVPPGVERALGQVLSRAPVDRFATAGEFARSLSQLEGPPVHHRRSGLWGWLIAAGLAALTVTGVFLSRTRAAPPTDPNLLAIAPFDVLDPSLKIWHEGLVDILARDLDGAGPLRTVAQSVGLKQWNGPADHASAESFGRRTGAGLVVFGSARKTRDTVSLRAAVLDMARRRSGPDLEVKGDTADIGNLADSLGVKILQVLGRDRPIGAVRQVSIGSRSLPALKAFLYGEQFYRRGLWDSALVYYDQAIARDSAFTLAFRRMALVLSWDPGTSSAYHPSEYYLAKSVQLNSGLSRRESMLISADSVSTAAEAASDPADRLRLRYRSYSLLEEAARSYPGDPEVWLALGEARFHSSAPIGGQPAAALEAFEHAIALDPGFAPAYEHTLHLATLLNRPDLARKYAEAYLRTDPTDVNAPSIRLAALLLDPSRAHTPETARVIDTASALVLFRAGLEHLGPWVDSGETGIRLARVLIRRSGTGVDPWSDTLMYRQYLAVLLAYRGHLREAYTVDRRLLLNPNASPFSSFGDPFLPLVFFRVIPDSLASVQFGLALRSSNPWSKPDYFTPRQLRGLPWWLARRDTAALARFGLRAGQEARRQRDGRNQLRARYLQSSAAAYLTLVRGDSTRALDLFQRISDSLCLENDCFYQKLTQAQLLRAHRQSREAEVLLDRWIWSADGPFYVLAVLERGRIAEGLGEREKAIDSYQFVLDVWRHADPELAPYIREARAGLARMASER